MRFVALEEHMVAPEVLEPGRASTPPTGPATATELAARLNLTRSLGSHHVPPLECAELITVDQPGPKPTCGAESCAWIARRCGP